MPPFLKIERAQVGHRAHEVGRNLQGPLELFLRPAQVALTPQGQAEPVVMHRRAWVSGQGGLQSGPQLGASPLPVVEREQLLHRLHRGGVDGQGAQQGRFGIPDPARRDVQHPESHPQAHLPLVATPVASLQSLGVGQTVGRTAQSNEQLGNLGHGGVVVSALLPHDRLQVLQGLVQVPPGLFQEGHPGQRLSRLGVDPHGRLELRFGLKDGQPKTLDEVARLFGITRERIRQIEARGILKLRQPMRSVRLEQFAEVE